MPEQFELPEYAKPEFYLTPRCRFCGGILRSSDPTMFHQRCYDTHPQSEIPKDHRKEQESKEITTQEDKNLSEQRIAYQKGLVFWIVGMEVVLFLVTGQWIFLLWAAVFFLILWP